MIELEWNYVSIVHENNAYGIHGSTSLQTELNKQGVCIRNVLGFNITFGVELSTLSQIIRDITLPKGGAVSGIVFFGGSLSAEKFLTAMADLELGGDTPSILFSEATSTSKNVFKDETLAASRGNLVVSPTYQHLPDFLEHWKGIFRNKTLLAYESESNPWLKDVFNKITECTWDNPGCKVPTEEQLSDAISRNVYLKFAVDAVFMFAEALKHSKQDICLNASCSILHSDGLPKFISTLKTAEINVSSDFENIFSFKSNGNKLQFDENGNIQTDEHKEIYSVYNHRQCIDDVSSFCFLSVSTEVLRAVLKWLIDGWI